MKTFEKKVTFGLVALTLAAYIGMFCYIKATDERGKHDVATNVYRGTLQTRVGDYIVVIDENDRGYGFDTIVNLTPVDGPIYAGITGHAYRGHTQWDRVFYCGENSIANQDKSAGCNDVLRTVKFGVIAWKFEPCPANVGKVAPFSDEAIHYAMSQLDNAMVKVRNREHLIAQYRWDPVKKQVVQTYYK